MANKHRGSVPIHHDSSPLVQWQSGRCSLTNQASPGQAAGRPFGGDPFPLPVSCRERRVLMSTAPLSPSDSIFMYINSQFKQCQHPKVKKKSF